jgi:UDP-N-acetylglucosamine transferase subunit ALG13
MIFLTVGTSFPFDRLVRAVDRAVEQGLFNEPVYGQIGDNSYRPSNFEHVISLEKHRFEKRIRQASSVISHAGIGTITAALDHRKPLLVMPRLKQYGEAVNDHQAAIARKFEQCGHILAAHGIKELASKIVQLRTFMPRGRNPQPDAVTDYIAGFLKKLAQTRHQSVENAVDYEKA